MLTQPVSPVKAAPKTGGWVMVAPDGGVYRWRRNDGRQTRTSTEAFLTPGAAAQAAQIIAQCYGVQFRQGVRNV